VLGLAALGHGTDGSIRHAGSQKEDRIFDVLVHPAFHEVEGRLGTEGPATFVWVRQPCRNETRPHNSSQTAEDPSHSPNLRQVGITRLNHPLLPLSESRCR